MNFLQGTYLQGRQDITKDISNDPEGRRQIQSCHQKAIISDSPASTPKRGLHKWGVEQTRHSHSTQEHGLRMTSEGSLIPYFRL